MSHINVKARRAYHALYRAKNRKKLRAYHKRWCAENPEKVRAYARKSYAANPQKTLIKSRRLKYGLSQKQFDERFLKQGRKCAVCLGTRPKGRGTWHADHDHKKNKFRGVLCSSCNLMLGLVGDSVASLRRAIQYLKGKK